MANRLASSSSPYLRQHRDNPVDWYPWGEEAFERAKAEDKPVFLSVGYSSCHWCHVMAHESFEDSEVAALLNETCICVKVDREERPDVDETYMTAVQLSSGRGGWPMSVFLTPEKKPFFAGTYFPKEDRSGYPGFRTIVQQIGLGWREARLEFEHTAHEFASALADYIEQDAPMAALGPDLIDDAVRSLWEDFDPELGGFGVAPKFPPHSAMEFLIVYAKTRNGELAEHASTMVETTLDKMRLGGIHDHVGGGYHRYSTDAEWRLPHFEKMLYDNALLMRVMPDPSDIAAWLMREMRTDGGLFMSALDADSEGEEGKFYVWSRAELVESTSEPFADAFDIRPEGNFHDEATGRLTGANVLFRKPGEIADEREFLTKLLDRRTDREGPGLDEKVITGWNALTIAGLVAASHRQPELLPVAETAMEALIAFEPLPRIVGSGDTGFLEDYAATAFALHELATVNPAWRERADRLTLETVARFGDPQGGFHATGEEHEKLFGRSMPVFDTPIPSGNALALRALLRTDPTHPHLRRSFERLAGWMRRAPQACEALILAYMEWLATGVAEDVSITYRDGAIHLTPAPGFHLQGLAAEFADGFGTLGEPTQNDVGWKIPVGASGLASVRVRFQICTDEVCRPFEERVLEFEG